MKTYFSLRWKILAWFFVNLAVIGMVLFGFLRVQFRIGINSLLAGPTGDRLEAIAQPLAAELRQSMPAHWAEALERSTSAYRKPGGHGTRAALFDQDGHYLTGAVFDVPPDVRQQLAKRPFHHPLLKPLRRGEGWRGRELSSPGGPERLGNEPPPDDAGAPPDDAGAPPDDAMEPPPNRPPGGPFHQARNPRDATMATTGDSMEKFMLVTDSPRFYWAGVYLGDINQTGGDGPKFSTLLLVSDSLRGGGLFFDYAPWLALGSGLALISVLMWLPFVQQLTQSLARMTQTAEAIAQGRFDPPPVNARRDELGRLSRALGHMAARLDGFVSGQKRFLGDTAHELLSPLARLEVALSILEQNARLDGDRRYVDRSLEEVRNISALVHDLLAFTKAGMRAQTAKLAPTPLAEIVRQAIAREAADAEIILHVPTHLRVFAEADLLSRAVANVIRNAVRYAGNAGPITISAMPIRQANTETVTLTIADNGPGVLPEAIERLFDPFYRPEAARTRETGGTGLGLAIVKNCVEACGGQASVSNREPSGLALTFILRRAEDASPTLTQI